MTQTILALLILAVSTVYVARRFLGAFAPKKKPCGCSGCGCSGIKKSVEGERA